MTFRCLLFACQKISPFFSNWCFFLALWLLIFEFVLSFCLAHSTGWMNWKLQRKCCIFACFCYLFSLCHTFNLSWIYSFTAGYCCYCCYCLWFADCFRRAQWNPTKIHSKSICIAEWNLFADSTENRRLIQFEPGTVRIDLANQKPRNFFLERLN